jgi:calcium/calmodulin-dependent protein kinase I
LLILVLQKKISDLGPQEVACGTPGYVAPEILRGDMYGAEVDIWSLGVITYVLLAGYPPFYDDDTRKLFRKIREARYYFHEDYWSGISPEAIDLIRKMICLDQRDRWTATQLLQHPWIIAADDVLAKKDITSTLVEMKRYNARRKLKAAANTIITLNRMKKMAETTSMRRKSEADSTKANEQNQGQAIDATSTSAFL